MIVTAILLAIAAQASEPQRCPESDDKCSEAEARKLFRDWQTLDKQSPVQAELGAGPHALIISDGKAMTRINYKTGQKCKKARDEIHRQVAGSTSTRSSVVFSNPAVKAFCVPL